MRKEENVALSKDKLIKLFLGIMTVLLVLLFFVLFYWDGYARDNGIYRNQKLLLTATILLIFCIVLFALAHKNGNRKIQICNFLFLILTFTSLITWLNSDAAATDFPQCYSFADKIKGERIKEISLPTLQEIIESEEDAVIYVGRESCPSCQEFYPQLEELACSVNKVICYYNTEQDRIERKNKTLETLEQISVFTVPSLVVKKDNEYHVFDEGVSKEDIVNVLGSNTTKNPE